MYILLFVGRYIKKLSTMLLIGMGLIGSVLTVEASEKQDFDELLEAIYSQWQADVTYEALQERLWACYNDPLALNEASREDLQRLCILTYNQLDQLFKHLAKNGPLISIYELQAISGFDLTTIQLLLPFVSIEEVSDNYRSRSLWYKVLEARNSYGLMRYERTLENKRGYQHDKKENKVPYAGSPNKLFTRLSIKHPNGWGLGLSARKGAGEAWTWDSTTQRYGWALWRFHWLLRDKKRIKTLTAGDYAVGYGQGLVLNTGFSMDKSSETIKVIRTNNSGIQPHTSVTTAAFRGVAATWRWHPIELTTYYSNIDLDGKVENNAFLGSQYVRNVSRIGYYRTQSEIAKKGKVNEQVIGSTLVYNAPTQSAELGINMLYSYYSLPIYPNTKRSNPFCFRGQHHANGSFFYHYRWQNFHFFGEGALSRNGGKAAIVGLVASLSRYADATVLWRHYGQHFHSPYGKAFRENKSSNSNERGIYVGARVNPLRHLHLDAYYDHFCFPWYFGKPRIGHSWLAKASYQLTKTALVYLQYKTTTKPRRIAKAKQTTVGTQHNYKLRWQYTLSKAISLKNEVQAQCSRYQQLGASTWGYAVVQDVTCKVSKLQLKGRVAWFNVKYTSNELYLYEPNVLHTGFNFCRYRGRGMRYCLLMCYQPVAAFRLELKYALTYRKDGNDVGSGQETIKGRTKNDATLQAIFKF